MSVASAGQVMQLVDAVIRAAGDMTRSGDAIAAAHGQTAARSLVLGALDAQADSIAGVARRRGLRRQSVQETMARLEADALVTRDDTNSRRSPTFTLTSEGHQVRAKTHSQFLAWSAAKGRSLDANTVQVALDVLRRLTDEPGNKRPTTTAPTESVTIRRFTTQDAVAVSRLIGHTMLTTNIAEYPAARLRELAEWFTTEQVTALNRDRVCLVATSRDAVLGTIGIELPAEGETETTLVTFFVSPAAQGRGVGRTLLTAIEDQARALGVTSIRVESSLTGAGFYTRAGFVPTGRTITGHAGNHTEMRKPLPTRE